MLATTEIYLDTIVRKFNDAAIKEDFKGRQKQYHILCSALTVLRLEGIEKLDIVYDDVSKLFSTIHLERGDKS